MRKRVYGTWFFGIEEIKTLTGTCGGQGINFRLCSPDGQAFWTWSECGKGRWLDWWLITYRNMILVY